jgi:hypothetical protein
MAIHDPSSPRRDDLRDAAQEARRIAGEAAHEADLERPTAAGAGGHPHPDIRAADHLRAQDDVRTFERQEDLAETQAQAAEALRENAARLQETREGLMEAREQVRENRDDVQAVARGAEALERQVDDAREQVRDTPTPDVR